MAFEPGSPAGPDKKMAMSQEAINALRAKMSIARGLGITQEDIDHAVTFLVRDADKRGEPYTMDEIETFDEKMQTVVLNALIKRVEARATPAAHVFESTGAEIGRASSRTEVENITRTQRETEQ